MLWIFKLVKTLYFKSVFFINSQILKIAGVTIGKNVHSFSPLTIESPHNIKIGNDVFIGPRVFLGGYNKITIGNNVMISGDSCLLSANHDFSKKNVPIEAQGIKKETRGIVIGDNVWIGTKVIILKKVSIGTGVVIGAGSVVTKDIAPYAIIAGNPAKVIKMRE